MPHRGLTHSDDAAVPRSTATPSANVLDDVGAPERGDASGCGCAMSRATGTAATRMHGRAVVSLGPDRRRPCRRCPAQSSPASTETLRAFTARAGDAISAPVLPSRGAAPKTRRSAPARPSSNSTTRRRLRSRTGPRRRKGARGRGAGPRPRRGTPRGRAARGAHAGTRPRAARSPRAAARASTRRGRTRRAGNAGAAERPTRHRCGGEHGGRDPRVRARLNPLAWKSVGDRSRSCQRAEFYPPGDLNEQSRAPHCPPGLSSREPPQERAKVF